MEVFQHVVRIDNDILPDELGKTRWRLNQTINRFLWGAGLRRGTHYTYTHGSVSDIRNLTFVHESAARMFEAYIEMVRSLPAAVEPESQTSEE